MLSKENLRRHNASRLQIGRNPDATRHDPRARGVRYKAAPHRDDVGRDEGDEEEEDDSEDNDGEDDDGSEGDDGNTVDGERDHCANVDLNYGVSCIYQEQAAMFERARMPAGRMDHLSKNLHDDQAHGAVLQAARSLAEEQYGPPQNLYRPTPSSSMNPMERWQFFSPSNEPNIVYGRPRMTDMGIGIGSMERIEQRSMPRARGNAGPPRTSMMDGRSPVPAGNNAAVGLASDMRDISMLPPNTRSHAGTVPARPMVHARRIGRNELGERRRLPKE